MALTTVEYTYSGQTSFVLPFPLGILNRTYVTIQINSQVDGSGEPLYYTDFTWLSDGEVEINNLTTGDLIKIARVIPSDVLLSDYTSGSNITRENLNIANKQLMMLVHEVKDDSSTQGSKLDTIEPNAKDDQTPAEIKTAYESIADTNAFTDADESKLDGIESGADVTDTTNVTAAGALMDSEVSDLAGIKSVNISTLQVKPSEGPFVDGDKSKLNTIETNADVTDTANVVAALTAGTNITIASDGTIASTATGSGGGGVSDIVDDLTPQLGGDLDLNGQDITGTGNISITGTVNTRDMAVDGAKLDAIEAGATADQTKADIDALNIDADTLDGQQGTHYLDYNNLVNTPTIPGSGPSGYATESYVDLAVADIVDSAPGTLDTLNELADALGDDPNFATTTATSLSEKLPKAGGTMTGDILFNDGIRAKFGDSNDLQIWHNGTDSYVYDTGEGDLILRGSGNIKLQSAAGTALATFTAAGASTLYYSAAEKLATTSTGIDVTGTVTSDALTVDTTASNGVTINAHDNVTSTYPLKVSNAAGSGNLELGTYGINNNIDLNLQRGGSTKLTVNASGIDVTGATNTTGPQGSRQWSAGSAGQKLAIYSYENSTFYHRLETGNATNYQWGAYDNIPIYTITNNTIRTTLTADGKFGVGTTGPTSLMHLASTAPYITFEDTDNNQDWQIQATAWFAIRDQTANAERMRIDSSGRVGIGTTSPSYKIDCRGDANTDVAIQVKASGTGDVDTELRLDAADTGESVVRHMRDGVTRAISEYTNSNEWNFTTYNNDSIDFQPNSTNAFRITDSDVYSYKTFNAQSGIDVTGKIQVTSADPEIFLTDTTTGVDHSFDGNSGVGNLFIHVDKNNEGSDPKLIVNVGAADDVLVATSTGIIVTNQTDVSMDGSASGQLKIQGSGYGFGIALDADAANIYTNSTSRDLVFGVNETEVARVKPAGLDVAGAIDVSGDVSLPDNSKLLFGNADDLEIYHDGNSWIRDVGTGNLYIDSGSSIYLYANGNAPMLYAQPGAGVTSYYNGVGKFATTSSGAEVIGNLDVSNALNVGGASAANTGFIVSPVVGPSRALQTVGNVNTTQTHIGFENLSGEIGRIEVSAFSVAYVTSSDYRLKTDVVPMTGNITRLKELKPCNFEWIGDGSRVDGFLAHEAQEVVPESVSGVKDAMKVDEEGNSVPAYQGIDQGKLVPLLTAALQEAVTRIETLEAQMLTLQLPQ